MSGPETEQLAESRIGENHGTVAAKRSEPGPQRRKHCVDPAQRTLE